VTRLDDMRIGDAERDAVTAALHDHFAAGRLDREELDERLTATLSAKTQGDLKSIVRDLPGANGLPEPSRAWGHQHPAPWHPHRGPHAAWAHGHPARHHGHRHGPFPAFPLLIAVFMVVAFTVGPGAAMLAVLQLALLVWTVRAILMAVAARRTRPDHGGQCSVAHHNATPQRTPRTEQPTRAQQAAAMAQDSGHRASPRPRSRPPTARPTTPRRAATEAQSSRRPRHARPSRGRHKNRRPQQITVGNANRNRTTSPRSQRGGRRGVPHPNPTASQTTAGSGRGGSSHRRPKGQVFDGTVAPLSFGVVVSSCRSCQPVFSLPSDS
jgi:hypothetical protein